MSGTTSLCLTQQWHSATHEPLVGGLLYSYVAGTLGPQNAYLTAALTAGQEYPNPVVLDASGRIPLMFYADGVVRLILTDRHGVAQFDYDNVPVIGSSGGGGGVDTTDTARLFNTGDMKIKYGTGALTGYVRGNGRGIGNSGAPGADEFADPTAQALFQYFWNIDPTLPVSTGRGASAVADWTALKSIATPDFRGFLIGGLDGMGSFRANRLTAAGWDALSTAVGGIESEALTLAQMPIHKHDVTTSSSGVTGSTDYHSSNPAQTNYRHSHSVPTGVNPAGSFPAGFTGITGPQGVAYNVTSDTVSTDHYHSISGTAAAQAITESNKGSGSAHSLVQPTRLVTVYFRL